MSSKRDENFIILLVTLACIGLVFESIMFGWEFWVPPLVVLGSAFLWTISILQKPEKSLREWLYFVYAMLAIFFHGVHESSFFDVSIVVILVLVGFSFFAKSVMMHLAIAEYACVMIIQFILQSNGEGIVFDSFNVSRIILHILIVLLVYFSCLRAIGNIEAAAEETKEREDRIRTNDLDMEDFLSNISHELRTPVNVVNGMSELMIKRGAGEEAFSIRDAGARLSFHIEDIQDYTECKRQKVILEEMDYISTSLINDVVTSFRLIDNNRDLELVVDVSPSVPLKMHGDVKKLHQIFRHLFENAVKFTKSGGIYIKMYSDDTDYGVNLCIEVTDTGIGMDRKAMSMVSEGIYQVNKKRNRSSGGIGLGLFIVFGFVHRMGGFVKIESEIGSGTTVRVTIPQKVVDPAPCLALDKKYEGDLLFHVRSDKYKVPKVRDFYRTMATNLSLGVHVHLYPAETLKDVEKLREKLNVTCIFMGQEEYEENRDYFDELSKEVRIAVSANPGLKTGEGSNVIVMPKPLYAYPVIKILNNPETITENDLNEYKQKPVFNGVKALVVDDEPMNLVVASGLLRDYEMDVETASGGLEAIQKCRDNKYDIIFMDHMMPEMDGVETMKQIKKEAEEQRQTVSVVALTANAVSGAREMFMKEGFDGFIAKPINIADFERVMLRVLRHETAGEGGEA